MMQPNSALRERQIYDRDLVISLRDEAAYVDEGLLSRIDHVGKIYRYTLNCNSDILLRCFPNVLHYFDRFWILLPASVKEQRTLWREFYKSYSAKYNQLIDCSRNLLCLRYFKQLLEEKLFTSRNRKVLDFGCGIGLSADIFSPDELVCYDKNTAMRDNTRKRGLVTINTSQFRILPPDSFDGCIACYVLHLAIDSDDLKQLARVLKGGGIIIANFYKGMQVDRVNRIFIENGLTAEQIEGQQGRFGSIYAYRKQ